MNDIENNGQAIRDAAAHDSGNKEQKRGEKRPAISAKAQTILSFLRSCTPYEADSIRVMVNYAMGRGDTDTIGATDMLVVNRFLNHGLDRENGASGEAVMKHRQVRAQKLMEAVKEFVNIGQLCRVGRRADAYNIGHKGRRGRAETLAAGHTHKRREELKQSGVSIMAKMGGVPERQRKDKENSCCRMHMNNGIHNPAFRSQTDME